MSDFVTRMIGAAKLQVSTYEEVEADHGALGQAAGVVILSAIAAGVASIGAGGGLFVVAIIGALVGWVVWAGLIWFIGTKLLPEPQTKADLREVMRTIGFSASPGLLRVLGIIPLIGWLIVVIANIWMLVAMVIAARQALDYQGTGRAVAVCIIGFIVEIIVMSVIIGVFAPVGPEAVTGPSAM